MPDSSAMARFHPEFKSRPMVPSPPFLAFLLASGGKLKERLESDGGGLKVPRGGPCTYEGRAQEECEC